LHNTYVVSYVGKGDGRGYFWEVDKNIQNVSSISSDWLLKKKYSITPLNNTREFVIDEVKSEEIFTLHRRYGQEGLSYKFVGSIKNNSGKNITSCSADVTLVVIYSDKKVIEQRKDLTEFKFQSPSTRDPWKAGESRNITVVTEPYDLIYLDYEPIEAFCFIYLTAEDPLGYNYDGAFVERNLKELYSK
jgi:hypothetical protein